MSLFPQIKQEIINELKSREVFNDDIIDRLEPATNFIEFSELVNTRVLVLGKWFQDAKVRAVAFYKMSPTCHKLGIDQYDYYEWTFDISTLAGWKDDCRAVGHMAQHLLDSIMNKLGGDTELGGALGL